MPIFPPLRRVQTSRLPRRFYHIGSPTWWKWRRRRLAGDSEYLLHDTFTDVDDTALTDHTPEVGGPWVALNGTFKISGNRAIRATNDATLGVNAVMESGRSDGTLTVTVGYASAGTKRAGIVFRAVDANNFWWIMMFDGNINIDEVTAGSITNRSSTPVTTTNGVDYAQRVVLLGTSIALYLDDVLIDTVTSAVRQTATKHGIAEFAGACTFNDFAMVA